MHGNFNTPEHFMDNKSEEDIGRSELVPRQNRGIIRHRVENFGQSVLGAQLEVFRPAEGKGTYVVMAGQHGTEPEGVVLLSSVLRSVPPEALRSSVVTALNPDGLARGTRGNANGVDLNRNFPTSNWTASPTYYCWNNENHKDTKLGTGATPQSEPETQALLHLLSNSAYKAVVSIHTPLGCIDDPAMSRLGKYLSEAMELPLVKDVGYRTPGSLGTWCRKNGVHLITVELPFDTIQNHRRKYTAVFLELLTGEIDRFV